MRKPPLIAWLLIVQFMVSGCTYSNLYSFLVPPNAAMLAETMVFLTRSDILHQEEGRTYRELINYGIKDKDIGDKSIGLGRIMCCGGPAEQDSVRFYIPPGMNVELGDIVEISGGDQASSAMPYPRPNTVLRIRQKASSGSNKCRWVPEDPRLWGRLLYCDGLEKEGWVQQSGLFKGWIKANTTK